MSEKKKPSDRENVIDKATSPDATAQDRVDAALAVIDEHLNGIQALPFMYGATPYAIEAMVFPLLATRAILVGKEPQGIRSASLNRILRRRFGERNTSAAGSLYSETMEEIADIMGEFIAAERKRVGVPSKVPQRKRARHWKRTPRGTSA